MNIFKKITQLIISPPMEVKAVSSEEQCALCWGFQEYDQEVRVIHKDRLKDVKNHSFKFMRIQRLLREQIGGIRSKNDCRLSKKGRRSFP